MFPVTCEDDQILGRIQCPQYGEWAVRDEVGAEDSLDPNAPIQEDNTELLKKIMAEGKE